MRSDTTIRLKFPWRGRPAGAVIVGLDYGVAEAMVNVRRWAEWAPGAQPVPTPVAAIAQTLAPPVLPVVPQSAPPQPSPASAAKRKHR